MSVLAVLGGLVLVVALLAMLIGRRLGDRFQYRLLLVVGLLLVGQSVAETWHDPQAPWGWLFLALGATVGGMAAVFLRRLGKRH